MSDFLLPAAWLIANGMQDLLPPDEQATVLYSRDGREIAHRFGARGARPAKPVLLAGSRGHAPVFIAGLGVTEAAELEDMAQEEWERQEAKLRRGEEPVVDFDVFRERQGYATRASFDTRVREGFWERRKHHMQNLRSDPPRQMQWKLRHWQGVPEQPWKGV